MVETFSLVMKGWMLEIRMWFVFLRGCYCSFHCIHCRPLMKKLGSFTDIGQSMIRGMMKVIAISWATQLTKEYVWVNIVLEVFKCFGWRKRVHSSLGPPNVCLNCSTRFCGTMPVWALWLHLSNFLNLFYKTSGDFSIWGFSFMVFLIYSLSPVKDLVQLSSVGVV
jgi:hypothetical protein